jgi:hypothetical protein
VEICACLSTAVHSSPLMD